MIDLPELPPPSETLERPAIVSPAPRQVSFGVVAGRIGDGTTTVIVTVDGRPRASARVSGRRFRVEVPIPPRDVALRVIAVDFWGHRTVSRPVGPVFGLSAAATPRGTLGSADPALGRTVRRLAREFPGTAAVYVQNLRTGEGAAWNAGARFPAASTLKVAIALEVLRTLRGVPRPGTSVYRLLQSMLVHSSNQAANALEIWLGGSISGGAARINATMAALGLRDSHIFGGYAVSTGSHRPIPISVESQPAFGLGKYTTAWDLARLHRYLHLAAGGRGPPLRLAGSFTAADARFALYLLAHVRDPGKLERYVGGRAAVLHKAGWITYARHDAGLVYWSAGGIVAAVMTWKPSGAGVASDVLAGRVARTALRHFSQTAQARGRTSGTRPLRA